MTDFTKHEPPSWRVADLSGQHEIGLFAASPIPLKFANDDLIPWENTKATVTVRGAGPREPVPPIEIIVLDVSGKKMLCSLDFASFATPGYYKIEIKQSQGEENFIYTTIPGDAVHAGTTDLIIRNI